MSAAENPILQADSVAMPEAVRALLGTYPGPALYVVNKHCSASNSAAAMLLERSGWWSEVELWLKGNPRTPLLVKIPTDASPITMEWTAITFSDTEQVLIGRNISLEKNLQEVLTDSRDRFRDLVELTADLAWETKADGHFSYIAGGKSLGYKPEELLGKRARDIVVRQPLEDISYFDSEEIFEKREARLRRADGSIARVLISSRPLKNSRGELRGARGICRDVTEAYQKQEELAQVQRRDRLIAEFVKSLRDAQHAKTALEIAVREIGKALNAAGCRIYNLDGQNALQMATEAGTALPEVVNGYNRRLQTASEARQVVQENLPNAALMGATTVQGAHLNGAIWVWRPVEGGGGWPEQDQLLLSEVADHLGIVIAQLDYQEKLRVLSECDGLTKLLNRRTFMEKIGSKITVPGSGSALFYVDLDNFKAVNDTHGHQRGDIVIKKLADVLHITARPNDLAGRMGGDEFVLWIDGINQADAESMAKRLVAVGADLRTLSASPEKPLGVSVGVALIPAGTSMRTAQLMEKADAAMYKAKRSGKSTWAIAD